MSITNCIDAIHEYQIFFHQELFTLSEHPSSPPVFSEVRVTRSLIVCVCCVDRVCPFVLHLLAIGIALSV